MQAGPVLLGLTFLLPSLDISQALSCLTCFLFSGLLLALLHASLFPSYAFSDQTARCCLKQGCCRQQLGYRLRDFLNRTAQVHAFASAAEELCPTGRCPWLCKYNAPCRPAKRGDAVGSQQLLQSWQTLYLQECIHG